MAQQKNNKPKKAPAYSAESLMIRLVLGVILIALGVLMSLSVAVELGGMFSGLRQLARGLCGGFAILLGVWPVWGGILLVLSAHRKAPVRSYALAAVMFLLLLAVVNLFSRYNGMMMNGLLEENKQQGFYPADGFDVYIGRGYDFCARKGAAGGALGMLFAWPLWKTVGCIAGGIVSILVMLALCIPLFRVDIPALKDRLQGQAQVRAQQREEERQRIAQEQLDWQRHQAAVSREMGYQGEGQPQPGQVPGQNMPPQPGPYAPGPVTGTAPRMPVQTGNTSGFAAAPGESYRPAPHEMYHEQIETVPPKKGSFVSRLFPGKEKPVQQPAVQQNVQPVNNYQRPAQQNVAPVSAGYTGHGMTAPVPQTVAPVSAGYTGPVPQTAEPVSTGYTGRSMSAPVVARQPIQPVQQLAPRETLQEHDSGLAASFGSTSWRNDEEDSWQQSNTTGRGQTVKPAETPAVPEREKTDDAPAYGVYNPHVPHSAPAVRPAAETAPAVKPAASPVEQPAARPAVPAPQPAARPAATPAVQPAARPAAAVQPAAAAAKPQPERTADGLLKPRSSWGVGGDEDDSRPPWEDKPEPVYADHDRIRVDAVNDSTYTPDLHLPPRKNPNQPEAEEPQGPIEIPYVFPGMALLRAPEPPAPGAEAQDAERSRRLEATLESFKIPAAVRSVIHGPAISRFELEIAQGIRVNKITDLDKNIAMNMAVKSVRIEAPIPGKSLVGIEVPNPKVSMVTLREVLESPEMEKQKGKPLVVALGKDVAGTPITCDLARMPHLLIAGATGSGKSVCINTMINSILYRTSPKEVRLILVDPKVVELQCYNGVPHLLIPVVSDPHKAAGALEWAVGEMMDRYHRFTAKGVRNIDGFNDALEEGEEAMPRIVIIIDELADLMMQCKKDVEERICRIAQLARACGIHLVVATQRPSVDVITGLIKANIPSRIAFKVSSGVDSRTILDRFGAETLLGHGDMLYQASGEFTPTRVQGCFLSDAEVNNITDFIRSTSPAVYDPSIAEHLDKVNTASDMPPADEYNAGDSEGGDDLLERAIEMAIQDGQVSTSMLQRRLSIGYARAGRIVDEMEKQGIISQKDGAKPRMCLISREEYEQRKSGGLVDA